MSDWQEYKEIWLQPWCSECEMVAAKNGTDGRLWCQDNPWDDCECGARPVKYVLTSTLPSRDSR